LRGGYARDRSACPPRSPGSFSGTVSS